jgi:glycolate oxidase FAD binding subunit
VIDYPARDLTITVEAGLTIAELSRRLAAERQCLPVDIPQADRATVGGAVAASPSGPRRFRWGTMRDYVIGIRAVDGRGVPFAGGGRVVKNAAGYDLCRLLTGSLGTLGVVTQVTLMVKPMPETSRLVACDVGQLAEAERLLAGLVRTQTLPAAVELLAGPTWRMEATGAARLVVRLEGTVEEVEGMVEQLQREWQALGVAESRVLDGDERDQLWQQLTEFPAQPGDDGATAAVLQIGVLPGATVGTLEQILKIDPQCSVQAHAGNGILRVRLSLHGEQLVTAIRKQIRSTVTAANGSMVVLSRPEGCELDSKAIWGPPSGAAAVMQAIKEQMDPKGILNSGRFIFGHSFSDSQR